MAELGFQAPPPAEPADVRPQGPLTPVFFFGGGRLGARKENVNVDVSQKFLTWLE